MNERLMTRNKATRSGRVLSAVQKKRANDRAVAMGSLVVLLVVRRASAEPTALHIEYAAPGQCPQQTDFQSRVSARTPLARFTGEPGAGSVRIDVRAAASGYSGRLTMKIGSGPVRVREFESAECADVVDALALVTALAIDPHAAWTAPLSPTAPAAPAPLESPTPSSSRVSGPTSRTGSPCGYRVNDGAELVLLTALAPGELAGATAFVELESSCPGLLAPSFRGSMLFAQNGVFESASARFALIAERLEVCPARIGPREASLRGCLVTDVGLLRGRGIDIPHQLLAKEAWLDVGAVARARWSPSGMGFFLEVAGGAIFPMTQPTFVYLRPRWVVHAVPFAAATLSAGAGVHF
jgi:hypothetical protein